VIATARRDHASIKRSFTLPHGVHRLVKRPS
jgi:hypothetical protein